MMGELLTIETFIPLVSSEKVSELLDQQRPIIILQKETDGTILLSATDNLRIISSILSDINFLIDLDFPPSSSDWRIVSDTSDTTLIEANSVWVANSPNLFFQRQLERREEVILHFKGSDGSVYSQISPRIRVR